MSCCATSYGNNIFNTADAYSYHVYDLTLLSHYGSTYPTLTSKCSFVLGNANGVAKGLPPSLSALSVPRLGWGWLGWEGE